MSQATVSAPPLPARRTARGLAPDPRLAWAVWLRGFTVFRRNALIETGGMLIEPLTMLGAIGFGLGQLVGQVGQGQSYAQFIAPGLAGSYAMFHALMDSTYGFYLLMSTRRVIRHMLETPMELQDLVLGEVVWNATRGAVVSAAVLLLIAPFGLVASPWALLIVPTGLLLGLAFASLGLCCAAVAPSINSINLVFNLIGVPMSFFCGVFFPVETLPDGLEPFVWALPLTQGVYLMRSFSLGEFGLLQGAAAAALAAYAVGLGFLAYVLLRRRLLR